LIGRHDTRIYSNKEVLERANKTFTVLENHSENGCQHCIGILREIFDKNVGSGPNKTPEPETEAIPGVSQNDLQIIQHPK
jgi:hypothetical protein